jgi:hypothetical protein
LNSRPLPYQGSALPLSYNGLADEQSPVLQLDTYSPVSYRAGDEARTRDLQLGRLSLYQLSYSRIRVNSGGQEWIRTTEVEDSGFTVRPIWPLWNLPISLNQRAREGTRTHDLLITNQLLYQLSYSGNDLEYQPVRTTKTVLFIVFFWEGKGNVNCQMPKF